MAVVVVAVAVVVVAVVVVAAAAARHLHHCVVRERAQHRHRLPLLPRLLERLLQREEEERGVRRRGAVRVCVRRPVRSETRPSVDLRLLEPVALGEPLSVRQVDARGERRVLLHQL